MKKLLQFHTGDLYDGRNFTVDGGIGMDGKMTITHKSYQRFLDIKRKTRNKKTNKITKISYPIHNRYAFGHMYSIANRLMFDLTDDVVAGIKKDFQIK